MRRPRQHRLTGSGRRLLGAAILAGVAAAFAVTAAAGPASADGLGINLNLGALGSISLSLPSGLPVTVPTASAPSTSAPGLPGTNLPSVCPTNCAASGPAGGGKQGGQTSSGGHPGSTAPAAAGVGRGGSAAGPGSSGGSSAASALGVPHTVAGLAVSPPPPVEPLTPLAGIAFGQAPYLWPLLVLLDVLALAGVMMLVRRTWSPKPGSD